MVTDTELSKKIKSGIIVIDKPQGPSSHQVTAWVKEILGGEKTGHGGTLDPMVSGLLVIMLGRTVKLAPVLLNHRKEYVALLRLHGDAEREDIERVVSEFKGKVYQRPPRKSAVKRQLRIREMYDIEVLDVKDRLVLLRVDCEAGTYIRSLCIHIGLALGTGGQMVELRRTKSGPFSEKDCIKLHDLKDAAVYEEEGNPDLLSEMILPAERLVDTMPKIVIRDSAVDAICRGAALAGVGVLQKESYKRGSTVAVMTEKSELVCTAKAAISSEEYKPGDTGIVARSVAVIMEPGTYPRGWTKKPKDDIKSKKAKNTGKSGKAKKYRR